MTEAVPEIHSYRELLDGHMPPWVMRIVKNAGASINRFSMIGADERILLGVSGGKDSLALALALSVRRKWLPIDYTLDAVLINWKEHPVPEHNIGLLREYFEALQIRFRVEIEIFRRNAEPVGAHL